MNHDGPIPERGNFGCLSLALFFFGACGVAIFSAKYSTSYKDLIFLWGLVLVAGSIPWGVWLFKWWTDPRNAPSGFKRWAFEARKEEVFLDWCQTQQWYGSDGKSDADLRNWYRANVEEQVRRLGPEELLQWCRTNLEKKGFWEKAGAFLEGAAEIALLAIGFGDGDDE